MVGVPKAKLAPLKSTLNAAAKLNTGTRKFDHVTPAYRSLNWLTLEARIHLKITCLTHKALYCKGPSYLMDKLALSGGSRTNRSASSLLLKPPRFKLKKTFNRFFSGMAQRIWNFLPSETRLHPSFRSFKLEAKRVLTDSGPKLRLKVHLSALGTSSIAIPASLHSSFSIRTVFYRLS